MIKYIIYGYIYDYNSYPVPFHAGDGLVVSTCFSKAWDKSWGE